MPKKVVEMSAEKGSLYIFDCWFLIPLLWFFISTNVGDPSKSKRIALFNIVCVCKLRSADS